MSRAAKWDRRFLDLAAHVAAWSKDPSTKCGAVIVDRDLLVVSLGYNGFGPGVADDPGRYADRDTKYALVIHAEENAVISARRDLTGCTLYTYPFLTCDRCAARMIRAGISRVVAPYSDNPRWVEGFRRAAMQYREAFVQADIHPASGPCAMGSAPAWQVYPADAATPVPECYRHVIGHAPRRAETIPGHGASEL